MSSTFVIPLILILLSYLIVVFLILKNMKLSAISIRSPFLLIFNIFLLFLMNLYFLIEKEYKQDTLKPITNSFYFIQTFIFVVFILRHFRIFQCINVNSISNDKQYFENNKNKYREKYYFKVLFVILVVISGILIAVHFVFKFDTMTIYLGVKKDEPQPTEPNKDNATLPTLTKLWMIINTIEMFILMTGWYFMFKQSNISYFIRGEIILFTITWGLIYYIVSICQLLFKDSTPLENLDSDFIFWSLSCLYYIILIIIGVIPLILTKNSSMNFSYYFTSGLVNNFYLFLSNESCYKSFLTYIQASEKDVFYLKLYTHIMKYRLEFMMDQNNTKLPQSFNELMTLYFNESNTETLNNIDNELVPIADKIRKNNMNISAQCNPELLDDALKYVYQKLLVLYNEFKKTIDFGNVLDDLKINAYIQCKLCNVGLLNKH